jgi:hypothetical protein
MYRMKTSFSILREFLYFSLLLRIFFRSFVRMPQLHTSLHFHLTITVKAFENISIGHSNSKEEAEASPVARTQTIYEKDGVL